MSTTTFGTPDQFAIIFLTREAKICLIMSNSADKLQEALPVAKALKADKILVLTSSEIAEQVMNVEPSSLHTTYAVYEVNDGT